MENKKDKKLPFAVLKKGAIAGVLGLTMGLSCFCLTGCSDGKDGLNGKDGADGLNGLNGTNIYVGYDGYIWQDDVRTTFKLSQDEEATEGVVEDTIGAYTTMKYWAGEYVDLSTNTIALMSNFKPNAKLTQYSGAKVTEIQVVAESAGTLHIGTAKVADVVTARTTGTTYTATTTSYNVTAGVNTITLDLTVAEDETIVLGGSNSTAKVYVVKNLPVADEEGNYTLVDSTTHTDVIATTGDYADTLAVRVKAESDAGETAVFDNLSTTYPASSLTSIVKLSDGPFRYKDSATLFSGKIITKIGVPVGKITAQSGEQPYITAYKIKTSDTKNFLVSGTAIKIYFPEDTEVDTWAYADCNIELKDDETLAFASSGDTIEWKYSTGNESRFNFYSNSGATVSEAIYFDIYVKDANSWNIHIENLEEKEQDAIQVINENTLRGYL